MDDEYAAPQKANELLELIRQGKRDRGVAAQAAVGVQAPEPAGTSEAEVHVCLHTCLLIHIHHWLLRRAHIKSELSL